MALVEKPFPLAKWPPPDGYKYKVKTGDNWVSIARRDGWPDPWGLIEFNFGLNGKTDRQRDSMYVNWYLKHYVGCVAQTEDFKNYRFSDDCDADLIKTVPKEPGVIYTKHRLQSGDDIGDHLPFWVRRKNQLPTLKQAPNGWDCWATVAAIMMSYRYGRSYTPREAAAEADASRLRGLGSYVDMYDHNQGLHPSRSEHFALCCGMVPVRSPYTSLSDWYTEMWRYGPLAVVNKWRSVYHARVLYGITGDGGSATNIHLVDPWPYAGGKTTEPFDYFQSDYETLYKAESNPMVWRWPGHA